MKKSLLLFFLLLLNNDLYSQNIVEEWKSYTALPSINQLISYQNQIWGISEGGLLEFSIHDSSFRIYGTEDGLSSVDISVVALDSSGNLWLGMNSAPGSIDIFNIKDATVKKSFNFDLTRIVDIGMSAERMVVAYQQGLNYGLLDFKFLNNQIQYFDFYPEILSSGTEITSVAIYDDSIFVGYGQGLVKAALNHPNLKDKNAWVTDNEIREKVYKLRGDKHSLWISTTSHIYLYVKGEYLNSFSASVPFDMKVTEDGNLLAVYSSKIIFLSQDQSATMSLGKDYHSATLDDKGNLWIGYSNFGGIGLAGKKSYLPDSPISNVFTALYMRSNGDLIAAGRDGISIFQKGHWKNYVRSRDIFHFSAYHRSGNSDYFESDTIAYYPKLVNTITEDSRGTVFFSIEHVNISHPFDGGILQIDFNDPENYVVYDTTDGILPGTIPSGNSHYVVIKGLDMDRHDNLWACAWAAEPPTSLLVRTATGEWYHFSTTDSLSTLTIFPLEVKVDAQDRVFIANQEPGGISILDYNSTLADKTDDRYYRISTSDGLASNTVYSLDLDSKGNLWVITSRGMQEVELGTDFNDEVVRRISQPVLTSIPFDLESRIRVDADDNKWILTQTAGVKIYMSNGSWWNTIEGFTEENSDILSNRVLSVAFDEMDGLAYLSTNKGISVLKTPFSGRIHSFSQVKTYPSPFRIAKDGRMIIDNLPENSSIKLLTLSGNVLRTLTESKGEIIGRQAFWDGKDDKGRKVASGVYLLYFYSESGKSGVTKIAVINK